MRWLGVEVVPAKGGILLTCTCDVQMYSTSPKGHYSQNVGVYSCMDSFYVGGKEERQGGSGV